MASWYVLVEKSPLPGPRFLAKDIKGHHLASLDRASKFRSKRLAEAARQIATGEWPEFELKVIKR